MRTLLFARDDCDLDIFEAGRLEKLMELHFAEAEPVIGVEFAGTLEAVAEQIENDDAAAFSQNPMRAGDRVLGMDRVMQRLAKNGEIDGAFRDRRIFDVAEAVFEICEVVLPGELRAELNHLRRIIDRAYFVRGSGEQWGKRSVSRAEIGDG